MPEIGWPELRVHPSHVLDAEDLGLADMWLAWRSGGMGAGPLPFAGGVGDQPACVMLAFAVMDAAEASLRPRLAARGG